jgi:glycosyltransferase involved in cell wall biosynthesis
MTVAVVIPTFNRATLLLETLDSVLTQTYPVRQIVVVDDGSTDETQRLIQPYQARGVEYIYQENAHLSAARNTGTRHLAPDIEAVLYLDSDDRLLPNAIERLVEALKNSPTAPVAYGRPRYITGDGERLSQEWGMEDFEGDTVYPPLMKRNFLCTAGCVLIRRSAIEAVGEWDTSLRSSEDWDMWLRLAENGVPFARVQNPTEPVLEYRVHSDSMSKNAARMRQSEIVVCRKHRERAIPSSERWQTWDRLVAQRERRLAEAQATGGDLAEANLTKQHRGLRRLIEKIGIAPMYRKLPLSVRLRLRTLLGIDRSA